MTTMDFNKFFQSPAFKKVLIALGILIVLLFVFKTGVLVGYKKAQFSYRWGENYHRNFGGPRGGFLMDMRRSFGDKSDFINAHGTFGVVIKVDENTIVVKGKDDAEKTVVVSSTTIIESRREQLKVSNIKTDDQIVVIGSPNEQGQIEAKLIRIFQQQKNDAIY